MLRRICIVFLFLSCLVLSCVWSHRVVLLLVHQLEVSWDWSYHQQTTTLFPRDSGLRPERIFVLVSFLFGLFSFPFFFCFFPFYPSFSLLFLGVLRYHGCVPGVVSLQFVQDGIPPLVVVSPPCILVMRCTYYFVLFFFPNERGVNCSLRARFQENELMWEYNHHQHSSKPGNMCCCRSCGLYGCH